MKYDYPHPDWKYHSMLRWRRKARWTLWAGHLNVAMIAFELIWGQWWYVPLWVALALAWYWLSRDAVRTAAERVDWIVEDEMRKVDP